MEKNDKEILKWILESNSYNIDDIEELIVIINNILYNRVDNRNVALLEGLEIIKTIYESLIEIDNEIKEGL